MATSVPDGDAYNSNTIKSNLDPYGFERPEDFDYKSYEQFMESYMGVLVRRAMKWEAMISKSSRLNSRRGMKIKRYIRKGIPNEHRGMVWMMTSGAQKLKDENPNMYAMLLSSSHDPDIVNTIKTDIPRTFPDNIYFGDHSGGKKTDLFNVLIAFACRIPEVGYCQGLNFIAGILLLLTKCEETTFWLMVVLVEQILPDYYTRNMAGLLTDLEVLSELVRLKVPLVHQHVDRLGLAWPLITTKWFICLFAEVLPIETVLRIWDALFYEGSKVLFRVAISLLMLNQMEILQAPSFVDATNVIKSITKNTHVINCHSFMQNVFKLPGSFSKGQIQDLRVRFREKVILQQQRTNSKESTT